MRLADVQSFCQFDEVVAELAALVSDSAFEAHQIHRAGADPDSAW